MSTTDNSSMRGRPHRGRGDQRPCDLCRARKARCLMQTPPCERCRRLNRACTFNEPTSSSQRRPSSLVIASRSPPGTFEASLPVFAPPSELDQLGSFNYLDQMMSPGLILSGSLNWDLFAQDREPTMLRSPSRQGSNDGPRAAKEAYLPPHTETNTNHRTLHDVSPQEERASSSELHQQSPASQQPEMRSSILLGPSAELDPFLRSRYSFDGAGKFTSSLRSFQQVVQNDVSTSLFVSTPHHVTDKVADLFCPTPKDPLLEELLPYKQKLATLFNQFVYPTYPIRILNSSDGSEASPGVLSSMFALALPWRSHDSSLPWAQFGERGVTRRAAPDCDALYRYTWQTIIRGICAPTYDTILACLLLLERRKQMTFPNDTPFDLNLISTAVTMAFAIGLNRNPWSWNTIGLEQKGRHIRLWWMLFIQDCWYSAIMGQNAKILKHDFDVPRYAPQESPSDLAFGSLLSLTEILATIQSSFMSVHSLGL